MLACHCLGVLGALPPLVSLGSLPEAPGECVLLMGLSSPESHKGLVFGLHRGDALLGR